MPPDVADWFLTAEERDNDATELPAWSDGNQCTPLIHGAAYFRRLAECVGQAGEGDQVFFTDWRGDPDEKLTDDGPTVAELFSAASRRGVCVRGLVWRSHIDALQFSAHENRALDREVEAAGGQVMLDQRVRRSGSHHQKLVVVRCPGRPEHDVAFVGGIDLCHSRRDDAEHGGDPQALRMAKAYGPTPPWHDAQLEVRGPAVAALETVFRERWNNPVNADVDNPIARVLDRLRHARLEPTALPPQAPPPPPQGGQHVQALRTYPTLRPRYRYAPEGERSIARGYSKAVGRATRLVYIEDQYLWSTDVGRLFADALRRSRRCTWSRWCRATPTRTARWPACPTGSGRPTRCGGAARPVATGCTCSTSRTTPGHRSTCTPRPASSTTPGPPSAATTSTAARGRTTASSPLPFSTPSSTRASPPTPVATAPGAGVRPRPAPPTGARAPRPPTATTTTWWTSAAAWRPWTPPPTPSTRGTAAAAAATARGRLRRHEPAPVGRHPALGDTGLPLGARPRRPAAAAADRPQPLSIRLSHRARRVAGWPAPAAARGAGRR